MFAHTSPSPKRLTGRSVAYAAFVLLILLAGGAYFYWHSLRDTPQYSLALIADAAKRGDRGGVASFIDTDAIVESLAPQVVSEAGRMYGRGIPQSILDRLALIARPLLPEIKRRAKEKAPALVIQRLDELKSVPFTAIVLGADRYADISISDGIASITPKGAGRQIVILMKWSGDRWVVCGVEDPDLAADIARQIGQAIVAAAVSGDPAKASGILSTEEIDDMLEQGEQLIP